MGLLDSRVNPCDIRFMLLCGAYGCSFLSVIFIIIALSTNNWNEIWDGNVHDDKIEVHFGLRRICFSDGERCSITNYDEQDYLDTVQGMVIAGGFMAAIASLFNLLMVALDRLGKTKVAIMIPAVALPLISAVLTMIGCIIYGEKVKVDSEYLNVQRDVRLGWSFGLDCATVGLMVVNAGFSVVACILTPTPKFL